MYTLCFSRAFIVVSASTGARSHDSILALTVILPERDLLRAVCVTLFKERRFESDTINARTITEEVFISSLYSHKHMHTFTLK